MVTSQGAGTESQRGNWGRRGSEEVVTKTSVFLSRETGMPGNFVGAHQGCQVPFRAPIPNVGFSCDAVAGKGFILR